GEKIFFFFFYESPRKGYGRGIDTSKDIYQFMFGDFEIDPEALKNSFEDYFKDKKDNETEI
ncbi:MAG: hypothetical protein KC553_15345, partial [Nitrospina sp.]|nr:hypothetical protein [Nitrospina sp.]